MGNISRRTQWAVFFQLAFKYSPEIEGKWMVVLLFIPGW